MLYKELHLSINVQNPLNNLEAFVLVQKRVQLVHSLLMKVKA